MESFFDGLENLFAAMMLGLSMGGIVDSCSEQKPELLLVRSKFEAMEISEFKNSEEMKDVFLTNFDKGMNFPKTKSCEEVLEHFDLTLDDLTWGVE